MFAQLPPTYHEISWTLIASYKDFLQEDKAIPRYVLDECLNVWFNKDDENLELYHTLDFAVENE